MSPRCDCHGVAATPNASYYVTLFKSRYQPPAAAGFQPHGVCGACDDADCVGHQWGRASGCGASRATAVRRCRQYLVRADAADLRGGLVGEEAHIVAKPPGVARYAPLDPTVPDG